MRAYVLTHVRDDVLLRCLAALVARERATTAELLAHIAEVDARKLYLPAAYASMHAYCVGELHLSEDAAYKRIQAARAGRRFPVLFEAVAEGRLHLAGVCLLAPYLTPENVDELVAAATHCRKSEIEAWLARRFGPAPSHGPTAQLAPGQVAAPGSPAEVAAQLAPGQVSAPGSSTEPTVQLAPASGQLAPGQVALPSADRIVIHLAMGERTHAKLCYAQALLSHALPSGDVGAVLDRALDALIAQLERRKFAAQARPRVEPGGSMPQGKARRPGSLPPRTLPAHVRRAVWERDRGRCTFRSDSGRSCGSPRFLEFDHVEPVARGGRATIEGLRLRCRAHNQYEAERVFGSRFMHRKRERLAPSGRTGGSEHQRPAAATATNRRKAAAAAAAQRRGLVAAPAATPDRLVAHMGQSRPEAPTPVAPALPAEHALQIWNALRGLGFRASEARRGVEYAATMGEGTLEHHLRAALQVLVRGPAFQFA